MPVNAARKLYLGKEGSKRHNCAQSVAGALSDQVGSEEEMLAKFATCGGGNAPEGLCGAFYAAKYLCEKKAGKERTAQLEKYFLEEAGSLKCREIKTLKKLSCLGCVEKCAAFFGKEEQ